MAKRRGPINSIYILQLIIGLFFIVLGLQGIMAYNSPAGEVGRFFAKTFGGKEYVIDAVVAILELLAGIIIVGALFLPGRSGLLQVSFIAILIFWIIRIVYVYFVRGTIFEPNVLTWSAYFLQDAAIFMAIWIVREMNS